MPEPWEESANLYEHERDVDIAHGMIDGSATIWISLGHAPAWLVKDLVDAINGLCRVQTGLDLRSQEVSATSASSGAEFMVTITGEPEALARVVRTVKDIAKRNGPCG